MFSSIRWRITIPYTIVILVTTLGLTLYTSGAVREARLADLEARLLDEAWLMSSGMREYMTDPVGPDIASLDMLARQWGGHSEQRVTVIGPDGEVWVESYALSLIHI